MARPDGGAEATPEAASDDSTARAPRPALGGRGIAGRIRASGPSGWLALGLSIASAVLLVLAELGELSYRTIGQGACSTRVDPDYCTTNAGDAHHHALWLVAAAVLLFGIGAAAGRSRPAALALLACGVAVLVIAIGFDMPSFDDKRDLDILYENVKGHQGAAFRLELIGGILAVAAGLAALTRFGRPGRPRRPDAEGAGLSAEERAAERARRRESGSATAPR
jgi:hypothetical protein